MLAPEMEADGICEVCSDNPGTLVINPFIIDHAMVPMVLCRDCIEARGLEP
jgi:hypothetical protein